MKKNISDIKSSNPSKAYAVLKRLGARPGDCEEMNTFSLPSHANLSSLQSAERIAEHFSQISQEYPPIDPASLPDRVKDKLNDENEEDLPEISEYDVFVNIQKAKKPKTGVPGDIPKRLVQEFSPELSTPITKIFKNIIKTKSWPAQWKVEYVTPIQKIPQPETEDDLRNISLTSFFSKVFERLLMSWLLIYVGDKLDPKQYGGRKKTSITHYLIDMVNFILYNQDLNTPKIVLACMIDFSKAFNRLNHNLVVTLLSDMGVPGWLLKLIIAFLEDRSMILRYKGQCSSSKPLPGGGPQGTILGLFLFLILINEAGFDDIPTNIGEIVTKNNYRRRPMNHTHEKYVDGLTILESINPTSQTKLSGNLNPTRPIPFHLRTGHVLKTAQSRVCQEISNLEQFASDHDMLINTKKTKMMLFNQSRTIDFLPYVNIQGEEIEMIEQTKLLGVIITSNLDLVDTYIKQVRSILEMACPACPVWHAALTKSDSRALERVQKSALAIILGEEYRSYDSAMDLLNLEALTERRDSLCLNFALKSALDPSHSKWFKEVGNDPETKMRNFYRPVWTRTGRYKKSPIPYLTGLLNEHYRDKRDKK